MLSMYLPQSLGKTASYSACCDICREVYGLPGKIRASSPYYNISREVH
jgi:hypothetical protein